MDDLVFRWTTPYLSDNGQELLRETIKSGQWSYGPIARQAEHELSNRINIKNVLLTNSGTSALWILLSLAKQAKPQAIVLPAFGYSAAANVASALGYEIYVADSCIDTPVVDPKSIKKLLDDKVTFIIGINYFGYSVNWDEIPKSSNYKIIEDAAGSFGAKFKNRPCGSNAELAIMSFHTSKAASAGGEGGCILSDDDTLIAQAKIAGRNGHAKGYYYSEIAGMNMLMTDLAACFLQDSIQNFDKTDKKRQQIIKSIDKVLKDINIKTPIFNHSGSGRTQNHQTYALLVENRDLIVDVLRLNGVETRPCWPYLLTEQPAISGAIKKVDGNLSNAKKFADMIINIPVNTSVSTIGINHLKNILMRMLDLGIVRSSQ